METERDRENEGGEERDKESGRETGFLLSDIC